MTPAARYGLCAVSDGVRRAVAPVFLTSDDLWCQRPLYRVHRCTFPLYYLSADSWPRSRRLKADPRHQTARPGLSYTAIVSTPLPPQLPPPASRCAWSPNLLWLTRSPRRIPVRQYQKVVRKPRAAGLPSCSVEHLVHKPEDPACPSDAVATHEEKVNKPKPLWSADPAVT